MAWFLFTGDMLVMLFMTLVVIWVSIASSRSTLNYSARIPLHDEERQLGSRDAVMGSDPYGNHGNDDGAGHGQHEQYGQHESNGASEVTRHGR